MIIAYQKPINELKEMLKASKKVLIVGCGTCVTVCMAGGEKEVGILASALRIALRLDGVECDIIERTIERQCEWEFVGQLKEEIEKVDSVLSMGCGVGVQAISEIFKTKPVYPALNTSSIGMVEEKGVWVERCGACGNCMLHLTGGICPIVRCSKSLLNGPCGGSKEGKCEIDKEMDCAWQLIYDRLKDSGRLEELFEIIPPKDWSTAKDGGPRKIIREDVRA